MRFTKFAATAVLAAAATGITAGTAYADPAAPAAGQVQAQPAPSVHGEDHGVSYTARLADAGKSVVTTVTGGRFGLAADGSAVALTDAAGNVVTRVPLTAQAADGKTVGIAAAIAADGSTLTLTPKAATVSAKDISSQQWFFDELQRASLGAAVGAVIGGLIGLVLGIFPVIPGAAIGAVVGLLVAGGRPLLDAGAAYFGGQP
ncbi:hypothetical protein [Nocardia terpenica]|uniref:DUF8020 domain-containing protein n=1 Tax=Nocardia terpenica TaxID=455432 RepID=A0A161XHI0_9NOCA|nr:hypothetical protein [Nocardia terpenica]KZM73008.1 hypothetical protein AWN90_30210 [Nocardia terpenica]NQE92050.1 hypothetical protein [Nocardia terpenica]